MQAINFSVDATTILFSFLPMGGENVLYEEIFTECPYKITVWEPNRIFYNSFGCIYMYVCLYKSIIELSISIKVIFCSFRLINEITKCFPILFSSILFCRILLKIQDGNA